MAGLTREALNDPAIRTSAVAALEYVMQTLA
jgi:hypothetical protein